MRNAPGTRDSPGADIPLEPRLSAAAIQARGLGWHYRGQQRPALDGLEFAISPGDLVIVLGATGSGRTTLARAMVGIVPHRVPGELAGTLIIDGQDVARTGLPALARSFGVVTPEIVRWQLMTRVADQVALGLENRAVHRNDLLAGVQRGLEVCGLPADDRVDSMSAGQRQMVGLAAALAPRPSLLVLDGPSDYLDASNRANLLAMIGEQSRRRDQTIVLIDRHAADLVDLADKTLVLDEGRQAYFGPPRDVPVGVRQLVERSGASRPSTWASALPVPSRFGDAGDRPIVPAVRPSSRHPLLVATGVTLELIDASGRARRTLVHDLDISLSGGERVALVGDNGAGASLLIQALAGEAPLARGSLAIGDGTEVPALDPRRASAARYRRLIGVIHERRPAVSLTTSVYREVSGGPQDPRADEMAWADLTRTLARFAPHLPAAVHPASLSDGAARLAQIARLLWTAPGIALLDQPDVGLDRRGVELLIEILDEMRGLGQAQLIATHDDELAATADSIIRLVPPTDG